MKNKPFPILATIFFVFLCFCVSCKHSSDNDSYEVTADPNELSVAVFAPISSDKMTTERFQRTADWFLAELAAAKNISSASVPSFATGNYRNTKYPLQDEKHI